MTAKELFELILNHSKERDPAFNTSCFQLEVTQEIVEEAQIMLNKAGYPIKVIIPNQKKDVWVNITFDQIVK